MVQVINTLSNKVRDKTEPSYAGFKILHNGQKLLKYDLNLKKWIYFIQTPGLGQGGNFYCYPILLRYRSRRPRFLGYHKSIVLKMCFCF